MPPLRWIVALWVVATAVGSLWIASTVRLSTSDPNPNTRSARRVWSLATVQRACGQDAPTPSPHAARSTEPTDVLITAWWRGKVLAKAHARGPFRHAVKKAASKLCEDTTVLSHRHAMTFVVTEVQDFAPILDGLPILEDFTVVPFHEGLTAELHGRSVWVTPSELHADQAYSDAIETPIRAFRLGLDLSSQLDRLARDLGTDPYTLKTQGKVRRFYALEHAPRIYPTPRNIDATTTRSAATDAARFLVRHQHRDGRYTYIYNAQSDTPKTDEGYNLTRHAGTTYYLAQAARVTGDADLRAAARSGLAWAVRHHMRKCTAKGTPCVTDAVHPTIGATALTTLAAAEYLLGGHDPSVRKRMDQLTAFLLEMQRPDGEMMHRYDTERGQPEDIQFLYYSGETALALLRVHRVTEDDTVLRAAKKLMGHLTGAGWNFFGSRYYYGEEHWTCIAAGEARDRVDVSEALDFCLGWAEFNRTMQYGPDETPWMSEGSYGVGPLFLPRLTPVASRTEAFISTYEMLRDAEHPSPRQLRLLQSQIEKGLGFMARFQWRPGPVHLFADPERAHGGFPGSPAELICRNDYAQHAGSAMLRWSEIAARSPGLTRTADKSNPPGSTRSPGNTP